MLHQRYISRVVEDFRRNDGRQYGNDNCRQSCQEVIESCRPTASSESLSDAKDGEVFNTEGSVEEKLILPCCRIRIFVIAAEEWSAAVLPSCRSIRFLSLPNIAAVDTIQTQVLGLTPARKDVELKKFWGLYSPELPRF